MGVYAAVLSVLMGLFLFLVLTRPNVEATFLRAPGALFERTPDGNLVNLYTVQLVNKTSRPVPVQLRLEGIPGKISIMGDPALIVPGEQLAETSVLIELAPALLKNGPKKFDVGVYSQGRRLQTVHTTFIGPRD
jgi:polyferredoxin